MSLKLPPAFTLCANGSLFMALEADPGATVEGARMAADPTVYGTTYDAAADLLVPGCNSLGDYYMAEAFKGGAAIIAAAFEQDVDEQARMLALKAFALRSVPISLIAADSVSVLSAFQALAKAAYEKHCEEIRAATSYVMDYHAEAAKDPIMSRYAFCGIGFMIHQLDKSWERVRSAADTQAFRQEVETTTIDWDQFFNQ